MNLSKNFLKKFLKITVLILMEKFVLCNLDDENLLNKNIPII